MHDIDHLKLVSRRRNPYPIPSTKAIRTFEDRFGVTLPQGYVEFLNRHNGCSSTGKLRFEIRGSVYGINDFFGLGPEPSGPVNGIQPWDFGNLWDETLVRSSVLGAKKVLFARDGGGNLLFLDFDGDPPSVGYLSSSTRKQTKLFPNFDAFIQSLFLKS